MPTQQTSTATNPLQSDFETGDAGESRSNELHRRKGRLPSSAYMESRKKAMASRTYTAPDSRDGAGGDVFPGWRQVAASALLLVLGVAFITTGAVFYWGSDGTERHARGKDILIVGCILLLPGAYTSYIYFGAWMKWQGFKYSQVPSLHYDDDDEGEE
mmetsp:Transcript_21436/g.39986  ORF Transcript_21436/g.39986 Transcript_21436/m.39986 type:complete len:158 (-) Transcript_21436:231-704(-)